ncbi:TIGR03546 family protein [bacterium]|nr:MAG: TIGR03546 family protein [bacterium]
MFGIDIIFKLIKLLNSEKHSPAQLAGGLTIGMIMGLTPWFSFHHVILIIVLILFNVNFSMAILGMGIFAMAGFALDGVFHDFGFYLLNLESMRAIYTDWYNSAMVLTNFNNTVLMGSFVASVLAAPIMFPIFLFLVKKYRTHALKWFQNSKVSKLMKGSKLFMLYEKFGG